MPLDHISYMFRLQSNLNKTGFLIWKPIEKIKLLNPPLTCDLSPKPFKSVHFDVKFCKWFSPGGEK